MDSLVPEDKLDALNASIKDRGHVDREHLTEFLSLIPSNDAKHIIEEVRAWLAELHKNPEYDKVRFPGDDINAILTDLDSYGRVRAHTLHELKAQHAKEVPSS